MAEASRARWSWRRRAITIILVLAAAALGYWAAGLVDVRAWTAPPPDPPSGRGSPSPPGGC